MKEDDAIIALADDIYLRRISRARATPPEQKLVAGIELFEEVRERMINGIRAQFPHFSDSETREELARRQKLIRMREMEPAGR